MNITYKRTTLLSIAAFFAILAVFGYLLMPDGGKVFYGENCMGCHMFRGKGGSIGPDLTEVKNRRNIIWMIRQIHDPKVHNPDSRMPSYDRLGYLKILAVVLYLRT